MDEDTLLHEAFTLEKRISDVRINISVVDNESSVMPCLQQFCTFWSAHEATAYDSIFCMIFCGTVYVVYVIK